MSEPIAERLSRLTPDAGSLDRDELLFAAGRASARPARRWQALTGILALGQALTLVILWPTAPPQAPMPMPMVERPTLPLSPEAPDWPMSRTLLSAADDHWKRPPDAGPLVPDEPPLHAFGALPADLLN